MGCWTGTTWWAWTCAAPAARVPRSVRPPSPWTPVRRPPPPSRRSARAHWDRLARAHAACAEADPAWVASLTTADAARDLEALRAALGAPRLHYYGVSWGTSLGVTYRTLFPGRSGRMLLESVVAPDPDLRGLLDG
ncbi:hypothetical protein Sdia_60490 [Streptomyces diastaticus subsp. diastaticus]|uniref:AB hydrolase-1 domain-containing protein n=1 Tax=Streptomyces diastaticus subsp. diastaticus TaxID=68040 RepID=A0ABQ1CYT4_STRDI|nr:alpha/beta hydrolase [Streptomyces diastaticus]GFH75281.1 hypothetical protein Sdia_60490 [Streptomyces diastaticus subsp. diastaticus]